jgi:hypothetical protein
VAGLGGAFDGGGDGAAFFVAHHHDEFGVEVLDGVFDAAEYGVVNDVAGYADGEEIAEAFIEDEFGRNARIGARQDYGERVLAGFEFVAAGGGFIGVLFFVGDVTLVSLH